MSSQAHDLETCSTPANANVPKASALTLNHGLSKLHCTSQENSQTKARRGTNRSEWSDGPCTLKTAKRK